MGLDGKVAIVTGGSLGIGAGIAKRLSKDGAKVVITARREGPLEETAKIIREAGGEVLPITCDVGNKEQVEAMFAKVLETWGTVDIVVNNGAWAGPISHILEMDLDFWNTVIQTNLTSIYLHCHRAANIFVDQGKKGVIVNISSFAATRSHRYMAAYDATKGGMEAMTRTMAIDLAPFGIRVNVVQPGAIHTEDHDGSPEALAKRGQTVPLGRVGYPDDIAGAVSWLVSDSASYVTGITVPVDGGMLAQLRSPQVDGALPPSVAARLKK
jgi:NAD(P)-dependent dehydrogenase (short-subunit alcohol dehydrogenase family)